MVYNSEKRESSNDRVRNDSLLFAFLIGCWIQGYDVTECLRCKFSPLHWSVTSDITGHALKWLIVNLQISRWSCGLLELAFSTFLFHSVSKSITLAQSMFNIIARLFIFWSNRAAWLSPDFNDLSANKTLFHWLTRHLKFQSHLLCSDLALLEF